MSHLSARAARTRLSFGLAALLACVTLGGAPVATESATLTRQTMGIDAFAHSGDWELVTNHFDGRYHGSSLRSVHPGAMATLDFEGRFVRIFGVMGAGGGLGIVKIDGYPVYVSTFFAMHKATHHLVFVSPILRRGRHHLSIEVASPGELKLRRGYVNIDSADVIR